MTEENFNLFAELTKAPRPHIIVDFPRKNEGGEPLCQIGLVVLNNYELMEAKTEAQKDVNRRLKEDMPSKANLMPGYESLYSDALAIEILYRSCKNPTELAARFFPAKKSLGLLSNDELGVLIEHYNTLTITRGPIIINMDDKEMEELMKKITDAGSNGAFFLNSLSLGELKAFASYTAVLCWKLLMDKNSLISQQEITS